MNNTIVVFYLNKQGGMGYRLLCQEVLTVLGTCGETLGFHLWYSYIWGPQQGSRYIDQDTFLLVQMVYLGHLHGAGIFPRKRLGFNWGYFPDPLQGTLFYGFQLFSLLNRGIEKARREIMNMILEAPFWPYHICCWALVGVVWSQFLWFLNQRI